MQCVKVARMSLKMLMNLVVLGFCFLSPSAFAVTKLHKAVLAYKEAVTAQARNQQFQKIKELSNDKKLLNSQDYDNKFTPVHLAIHLGLTEVRDYFLSFSMIDKLDLHLEDSEHRTVFTFFLEKWTDYEDASRISIFLTRSGFDPHKRDLLGNHLIHYLARGTNFGIVKAFIVGFCEPNKIKCKELRDRDHKTPYEIAVQVGSSPEMIALLKTETLSELHKAVLAYHQAIQSKMTTDTQLLAINKLIETQPKLLNSQFHPDQFTPFHLAIHLGLTDLQHHFFSFAKQIDFTRQDRERRTPFTLVLEKWTNYDDFSLINRFLEVVENDVHKRDLTGNHILHYAAQGSDTRFVEGFIAKFCSPSTNIDCKTLVNRSNETAYDIAVKLKKSQKMIEILKPEVQKISVSVSAPAPSTVVKTTPLLASASTPGSPSPVVKTTVPIRSEESPAPTEAKQTARKLRSSGDVGNALKRISGGKKEKVSTFKTKQEKLSYLDPLLATIQKAASPSDDIFRESKDDVNQFTDLFTKDAEYSDFREHLKKTTKHSLCKVERLKNPSLSKEEFKEERDKLVDECEKKVIYFFEHINYVKIPENLKDAFKRLEKGFLERFQDEKFARSSALRFFFLNLVNPQVTLFGGKYEPNSVKRLRYTHLGTMIQKFLNDVAVPDHSIPACYFNFFFERKGNDNADSATLHLNKFYDRISSNE